MEIRHTTAKPDQRIPSLLIPLNPPLKNATTTTPRTCAPEVGQSRPANT
jgi:hypothetical protein